jgi:FPC/CPF motif-containing protein YcgG
MTEEEIRNSYYSFLKDKTFPCVAAKASVARDHVKCLVVGDMHDNASDNAILSFLYDFIDSYRIADSPFHSTAIIFRAPQ